MRLAGYSCHKKGNSIMPRKITNMSRAINTRARLHQPGIYTGSRAVMANLLSIINIGVTNGKPRMAISAEFCCARAAIADKNVNTAERLRLPVKVMMTKRPLCASGQPSIRQKSARLTILITNMRIMLYSIFAIRNVDGFTSV